MGRQSDKWIYAPSIDAKEMVEHRGFHIDARNRIYKNGKQVFTAYWQQCYDQEQAKGIIDASMEQIEKQQAQPCKISPVELSGECELENGSAEQERFIERMSEYYEHLIMIFKDQNTL